MILFYIYFNFLSTGCFLYPVKQTCLSNYFDWSLSFEIVDYMNLHYETWAKGERDQTLTLMIRLIIFRPLIG